MRKNMSKTFTVLCEELGINPEQGEVTALERLETWCQENISLDIVYQQGDTGKRYQQYVNLAKHYLDEFLPHIPLALNAPIPGCKKMNALQYAAIQGYHRYFHTLLLESAQWNTSNTGGMSLLHLAASKGNVHTVQILLEKGANPNQMNQHGQPPIFSALITAITHDQDLISRKEAVFNELKKYVSSTLMHQDNNGETIMHLIAIYGFDSLLSPLLATHNELAFLADNMNECPIHKAIANEQTRIIQLLRDNENSFDLR
jgi:ankyrin repeat protein